MNIFYRPMYRSDATEFLDQLRQQDASLAAKQSAGRALLWNKLVDRLAWRDYRAAQVPQPAYVYQTSTD